jgi:hypothetical protein
MMETQLTMMVVHQYARFKHAIKIVHVQVGIFHLSIILVVLFVVMGLKLDLKLVTMVTLLIMMDVHLFV